MVRTESLILSLWLALGGCSQNQPTPEPVANPPQTTAPEEAVPESGKPAVRTKEDRLAEERTYAFQLAKIEKEIAGATKVAEGNPRSFIGLDRAAQLYMSKARLTGSYDDYAEAEKLLDRAFAVRDDKFGPYMTRARLNFTLHRLDRVDADFAKDSRVPGKSDSAKARSVAFVANLAMQRGQYDRALGAYEASLQIHETSAVLSALGIYHWKTGDFAKAEELLEKSLAELDAEAGEPLAWTHLMIGLLDLDRGRYDDALAHYRTAESYMTGYWLVDEHIAEVLTLLGKTEEAKALYLDIIARTDNPEFMDAMAEIEREEGDEAEAKEWIAKAEARYEAQLAQFPEAAYGHALEHFLEFGEDPKQTLAMAEKNHALRPNAEAKTLLAQAYLKADEKKKARKTIEAALKTPYSTADLHLAAAEVFRAVGDEKRSAEQLAKAKAINPKVELEPSDEASPPAGG